MGEVIGEEGHDVCVLIQVAQAEQGLPFGSEKEVFDFLGFKYLEPHERNL